MKKLLLKVLLIGVVVYSFIGFFLLPYFVQFSIPPFLKKNYGIEIYIDSVHFNPFNFSLKIDNFILKDKKKHNLLYFENLFIDLDPIKLFNKTLYIKKISLDNSRINIAIDKEKKTNFQFLLDTFASKKSVDKKEETKQSSFHLFIKQFDLSYFNFLFNDASKAKPFDIETKPINLTLKNISLDKDHLNKINLKVATKKSGEVHLVSTFVADPLSAKGKVSLRDIALNKFYYYLKPNDLKVDINSKIVNSSLDYDFQSRDDKVSLNLSNIDTNLEQAIINVEKFKFLLKNFLLNIDTINFGQESNSSNYKVDIVALNLKQLRIDDIAHKTALDFFDLNSSVKNISSDKKDPIEFAGRLKTGAKGDVKVLSSLIQEPLETNGTIQVNSVDLTQYKPYIEPFINIDLQSALGSVHGQFHYMKKDQKDSMDIKSDIALKKIDLANKAMKQPLIKIDSIDVSKLHFTGDKLDISKVVINEPDFKFYLNDNNTTNFTKLFKSSNAQEKEQEKQEASKAETKDTKNALNYTIKEAFIKNGDARFFDNRLKKPFKSHESDINVYAKNITSKKDQFTIIEHDSILDKYGILRAKGKLIVSEPLKNLDVNLDLRNFDLANLSSYAQKYIGNKIDNGRLSLKVDQKIKDENLTTKNNIRIKDIKLGEKVESKDAINAPIGLAIALLEDSEGYIDLDIPIDGDLKNPNFHIGDVIGDVIRNTIVGIVSAPFKFLAAIIGVDFKGDISNINFDYGNANINAVNQEKLDKLIKALEKRPGLELKIKPSYLAVEDTKALKEKVFKTQYAKILDVTVKLPTRLKEVSKVFIKLYSKKEYEEIKLKDEKKLTYMLEKIKDAVKVSKEELIELAKNRVENIKNYLVTHKIKGDRIKISDQIDTNKKEQRLQQVVVSFELGINKKKVK